MMISKYFSSAFAGIVSARTRGVLALLGIAMGIFLVVILMAVGKGVQKDISDKLVNLGPEVLVVSPVNPANKNGDESGLSTIDALTSRSFGLDDVDLIKSTAHVSAVAPVHYYGGRVHYKNKSVLPSPVASTTPEYQKIRQINLESGRFLSSNQDNSNLTEAVIGHDVKTALFGQDEALGKIIRYDDKSLKVVGVFEASQAGDGAMGGTLSNAIYTQSTIESDPKSVSTYSLITVRADGIKNVAELKQSLIEGLSNYKDKSTFKVVTSDDLIEKSTNMLDVLSALILVLAVISLFISGIGIMNMMVVSVTDRTKEIGVRKTVGATSSNIFWQFLIEAVMLTLIGGLLGILLSYVTAYVISKVLPFSPVIGPELIILGAALSITLGVVFGVGPAINAARKEPIESLHTDHT